jgi:hypothetical protein
MSKIQHEDSRMRQNTPLQVVSALIAAILGSPAAAHIYVNFPTYDRGGLYEESKKLDWALYEDGAFGPVRFNVQHACGHAEFSTVTTKQVVIVMPNGKNTKLINTVLPGPWNFPPFDPAYKELGSASPDAKGHEWAINWLKPMTQASFPKAYPILGQTSGGGTVPRAVVWVGDHPDGNDADLAVTMEFPTIPKNSCVKEVQYFFPMAQFCGNTDPAHSIQAWMLGTTDQWSKSLLGESNVQWAPTLFMRRDLKKKPLPTNCGQGQSIGVYPSREDIDKYLRPVSVDTNGVPIQKSVQWWINNAK